MARKASMAAPIGSAPRHGFGGDHPGFTLEPGLVQRANDVEQMPRGHLVPPTALHAEPGKQRDERGIAVLPGEVDRLTPFRLPPQADAEPAGQAVGIDQIEPAEAGETGDQEARLALAGAVVAVDE